MLRLLRLALQFVLFFLLLSLVVAVAAAETGVVEKVALIAAGECLCGSLHVCGASARRRCITRSQAARRLLGPLPQFALGVA